MCLMNSVRWSDWTGKATERSSETTQREVDETMWRAPESAREWSNALGPSKKGRVFSRERRGRCTHSTAGEGTREHSRRRDTRAKQEKGHESTAGEDNSTTRKQNMTNRKGNHD